MAGKAPTRFVYIPGKLKWARTTSPDKYSKWSVVVYPNEEGLERIHQLIEKGIKNPLRKDEDGYYMTFSRPVNKMIRGKVVAFTPPEVTEKDGTTKLKDLIGNGSDGVVTVEVYSYESPIDKKQGAAARLLAIRVDNLVPYNKASYDEDQLRAVKGLDQQPISF